MHYSSKGGHISLCLLCRLPERQSKCELEVDACVEDILNRQEVPTHTSYHPRATVVAPAIQFLRASMS